MRVTAILIMFLALTPMAIAQDGDPAPTVPWSTIITVALSLLALIGITKPLISTINAYREALGSLSDALEDGTIDDAEIKLIVKTFKNCSMKAKELVAAVKKLF